MAPTLRDLVSIEALGPNEFVSKINPVRLGNAAPIAYGGCALSTAMRAAFATVPDNAGFAPYSMLGHYLGPAATDRKLYARVTSTRQSRSFATRRVEIRQKLDNGQFRNCLEATVDFHAHEPSVMEYSAPTWGQWAHPEDCPVMGLHAGADDDAMVRRVATDAQAAMFRQTFASNAAFFETRNCTNGVAAQNLNGVVKTAQTTQHTLPLTARLSADWSRGLDALATPAENFAALVFLMDGGLSFLPLCHGNLWFDDVGACSSLDFAARFFTGQVRVEDWVLRERQTSRAGEGRTYSEGRFFDVSGQMVASMTQQSIMRARPARAKKDQAKM
ncbi:hypothetical protein SPBR_01894 [Sporothrix brasiliensis 5110]|uniref:Acyl-CoA thioesterase II n=1 Tax=Sporothrix brasiliensis 5110 TaxID=1398154 RepID=A0A0C2IPS7_9PEZI|nr:uncharacterized protein SPBR_01894 [Sporothrix brasiliensis 5110]KIH91041.1 hypothetical protein SPBR_01894 [Sporothrix brasiliensis 5110]